MSLDNINDKYKKIQIYKDKAWKDFEKNEFHKLKFHKIPINNIDENIEITYLDLRLIALIAFNAGFNAKKQ